MRAGGWVPLGDGDERRRGRRGRGGNAEERCVQGWGNGRQSDETTPQSHSDFRWSCRPPSAPSCEIPNTTTTSNTSSINPEMWVPRLHTKIQLLSTEEISRRTSRACVADTPARAALHARPAFAALARSSIPRARGDSSARIRPRRGETSRPEANFGLGTRHPGRAVGVRSRLRRRRCVTRPSLSRRFIDALGRAPPARTHRA